MCVRRFTIGNAGFKPVFSKHISLAHWAKYLCSLKIIMYEDKISWKTLVLLADNLSSTPQLATAYTQHDSLYIQYNTCHVGKLHDPYISCFIHRLTTGSDSCYVHRITRIWLMLRTEHDSYTVWLMSLSQHACHIYDSRHVRSVTHFM